MVCESVPNFPFLVESVDSRGTAGSRIGLVGGLADAFNALLAVDQRQEAGRPCVLNKDGGNNMADLAGEIL